MGRGCGHPSGGPNGDIRVAIVSASQRLHGVMALGATPTPAFALARPFGDSGAMVRRFRRSKSGETLKTTMSLPSCSLVIAQVAGINGVPVTATITRRKSSVPSWGSIKIPSCQ